MVCYEEEKQKAANIMTKYFINRKENPNEDIHEKNSLIVVSCVVFGIYSVYCFCKNSRRRGCALLDCFL